MAPLTIAKDELERQMAAHSRTLDKVSTGVAVFGADRKLAYSNDAFARIWALDEAWLQEKPAASELFDLLRQRRLLPEQANYRKWRDDRLLTWDSNRTLDEFWHRADGRTVHVVTDCRGDGGVTFLFDDVTEKLSLERQYHSLIESQRETLDHLNEGIAVFGADGRLQLFNPAFQTIWHLPDAALQDEPHLEVLIAQTESQAPDPQFWQTLRDAITGMPEERDTFLATIGRQDGTHLAYTVTPLPDGGTLVTFADVTDRKRFEDVLMERNEALEASDRLKNSFLSHVSYELRTPLTTIIGFTDLLAEPAIGPLNVKQRDYLNDIKTSSQALLNIINDILDLAVIDAGALDLKLSQVDLKQAIEAAAAWRARAPVAGQAASRRPRRQGSGNGHGGREPAHSGALQPPLERHRLLAGGWHHHAFLPQREERHRHQRAGYRASASRKRSRRRCSSASRRAARARAIAARGWGYRW